MVLIVMSRKEHKTNQTQDKRSRDSSGGDKGAGLTRLVAAEQEVDGAADSRIPARAHRRPHRSREQQYHEREKRQQRRGDVEEAGLVLEVQHRGYPFNSSAVSTSTVMWLL